jgi:hypothetical protein
MARNHTHEPRNMTNYVFWLLLLQAISFILLGVLVLLYPALLFFLAAVQFLWMGFTTLLLAMRVRTYGEQFPAITDELKHA